MDRPGSLQHEAALWAGLPAAAAAQLRPFIILLWLICPAPALQRPRRHAPDSPCSATHPLTCTPPTHLHTTPPQGHVYVGVPPLYKLEVGRQSQYCYTEEELSAATAGLAPGSYTMQRFKVCDEGSGGLWDWEDSGGGRCRAGPWQLHHAAF